MKDRKEGPKRPKSAYIFFTQERRLSLKTERPELGLTDASKVLGAEWKELTDAGKQRFVDMASQDRTRYSREKGDAASASD